MAQVTDKQPSVLRSLDWWTIIIYVALLCFGWISVCGASYTYGDNDIFSLGARSGMQIVWIGTSIALGFVLLMLDSKFYDTFAYVIYMVLLLLLFATIFNPHEIKGSRSWLVLGPLRLQPAEFAKFATALAVAKFMSAYGFDIHRWRDFATACGIVLLPMLFIVAQKETGSALVYLSFFLMFYREGMPGSVLFTGVAMVVYFVVGIRYGETLIEPSPTPIGPFVVLLLVQIFTAGMVRTYCKDKHKSWLIIAYSVGVTVLSMLVRRIRVAFQYRLRTARSYADSHRLSAIPGVVYEDAQLFPYPVVHRRFGGILLFCKLRIEQCDGASSASAHQRAAWSR